MRKQEFYCRIIKTEEAMKDKDKIRAEVERLKENVGAGLDAYDMGHENGAFEAYVKVLSFIDSLPEEPCDDLEQEIRLYHEEMEGAIHYAQCARHFARWQEEQMINKACEWLGNVIDNGAWIANDVGEREKAAIIAQFKEDMEEEK